MVAALFSPFLELLTGRAFQPEIGDVRHPVASRFRKPHESVLVVVSSPNLAKFSHVELKHGAFSQIIHSEFIAGAPDKFASNLRQFREAREKSAIAAKRPVPSAVFLLLSDGAYTQCERMNAHPAVQDEASIAALVHTSPSEILGPVDFKIPSDNHLFPILHPEFPRTLVFSWKRETLIRNEKAIEASGLPLARMQAVAASICRYMSIHKPDVCKKHSILITDMGNAFLLVTSAGGDWVHRYNQVVRAQFNIITFVSEAFQEAEPSNPNHAIYLVTTGRDNYAADLEKAGYTVEAAPAELEILATLSE